MGRKRRRKPWEIDWDAEDDHEEGPRPPELDLHGCNVGTALRRVAGELARVRARGGRTLVVVVGRGFGSHGGRAKVGPEVERWLRGAEARQLGAGDVRSFNGGGALEVSIVRG